jgi:hypothetical protein
MLYKHKNAFLEKRDWKMEENNHKRKKDGDICVH